MAASCSGVSVGLDILLLFFSILFVSMKIVKKTIELSSDCGRFIKLSDGANFSCHGGDSDSARFVRQPTAQGAYYQLFKTWRTGEAKLS